ncbi:hypothetical protein LTR78_008317 [Recurvomyces mirabilis]|uniref:Rhodopsin domain-containing protein n=2 Tax=Recurvomyces mirabilis TaxID=574656 RepID=A0AAE0TR57_9PEZI|nr:hypothetical protein LTR78_008317 [Recurvomyces mirabilis]
MTWVHNATPEVDGISHYPAIIAVSVSLCWTMLIVVAARGVYRRRSLGSDDFVIFVTALFSVLYTIFCVLQTRWGLGLPTVLRPAQNLLTFKRLSYSGKPWYQLALGGYKVALCIGYTRFLADTDMKSYRRVIIATGVFCGAFQLVCVLLNLFSCLPIRKNFDQSVPGTCLPFLTTQYPMASIGILCDVIVFLLPIPLFTRLSFSRGTIIGLCILFACGLITTICSIVRATYLSQVGPRGSGDNTNVVLWGTIEINVGIIMSCLPFLHALLAGVFRKSGQTIRELRHKKIACRVDDSTISDPASVMAESENGDLEKDDALHHGDMQRTRSHSSDEPIMAEAAQEAPAPEGIIKTTQVEVFEERIR